MATYKELTHTPAEIVTLQEFKAQLKEVDPTEVHPEDALFQLYVDASVEECEDYINRAIIERKYKISGKSFQEVIVQSLHTIQSIDKIEYKPENYVSGVLEVLPEEAYSLQRVDKVENRLEFTEGYSLPTVKQFTPDAVQLYITVGLGKVSKKIKQAVLLKAAAMDQFRSDYVKQKTTASETLLQAFKKY
jgi:hypothetical protein